MKAILSVPSLLMLVPTLSPATIIVTQVTPERVIIAADSRQTPMTPGVSPSTPPLPAATPFVPDDRGCKITALDPRTLFAVAGRSRLPNPFEPGGVWVSELASRALGRLRPVEPELRLVQALAVWGELVRFLVRANPGFYSDTITEALFAATNGQEIQAYGATIAIVDIPGVGNRQVTVNNVDLLWRQSHIVLYGNEEAVKAASEFFAGDTSRAKAANNAFNVAFPVRDNDYEPNHMRSAVEAVIKWLPDEQSIGGPIDVAVLDKTSGIRWVQRKETCR